MRSQNRAINLKKTENEKSLEKKVKYLAREKEITDLDFVY